MKIVIWIFLLICLILIMYSYYKTKGMDYSAGRGFWKNSDYAMKEDNKEEFSDYNPYNYDNLRK